MFSSNKDNCRGSNTNMKPKKPLSAFDIFFQEERQKILQEAVESGELTTEEVADVLLSSNNNNNNSSTAPAHRPKRKKRGKIGRKEISRRIAAKWSTLPEERKKEYEAAAKEDLGRCRRELKMWKKSQHINECQPDAATLPAPIVDTTSNSINKSAAEPVVATLSSLMPGSARHHGGNLSSCGSSTNSSPMLMANRANFSSMSMAVETSGQQQQLCNSQQMDQRQSYSTMFAPQQETQSQTMDNNSTISFLAFEQQNGNSNNPSILNHDPYRLSRSSTNPLLQTSVAPSGLRGERSLSAPSSPTYEPSYDSRSSINMLASQCDGDMLDFLCSLKQA